ncbi:MAG: hypothetical protein MHPSP_002530 [Paramarteilia canceri]
MLSSFFQKLCAIHCRFYKVKKFPYRRCTSCYFVVRDNRKYVECTVHNRHRLMQFIHPYNYIRDYDWRKRRWYLANGPIIKQFAHCTHNGIIKH